MPIVEIPDKGMVVQFPDDMPENEIEKAILYDVYGHEAILSQGREPTFLEKTKNIISDIFTKEPGVGPLTEEDKKAFKPVQPEYGFDIRLPDFSKDIDTIRSMASDMGLSVKDVANTLNYGLHKVAKGITSPVTAYMEKIPGSAGESAQAFQEALDIGAEYYKQRMPETLPDAAKEVIGQSAELAGWLLPFGAVRGAVEAGVSYLPKTRPVFKAIATGMGTGAILGEGDKDQTLVNMTLFGVLEPLGLKHVIKYVTKKITNSVWWRNLTVKERGLVVYDLEKAVERGDITLGEFAKRDPEAFVRELAKRRKGEPPSEKPVTPAEKAPKGKPEEPVKPEAAPAEGKEPFETAAKKYKTAETERAKYPIKYLEEEKPMQGFGKGLTEASYEGSLYHSATLDGLDELLNAPSTETVNTSTVHSRGGLFGRDITVVFKPKQRKGLYTPYDADAGKNFGYDEFRVKLNNKDIDAVYLNDELFDIWKKDVEKLTAVELEQRELLEGLAEDFAIRYKPQSQLIDIWNKVHKAKEKLYDKYQKLSPDTATNFFNIGKAKVYKISEAELPKDVKLPNGQKALAFNNGKDIFIIKGLSERKFKEAINHELVHLGLKDNLSFYEEYPDLKPKIKVKPKEKAEHKPFRLSSEEINKLREEAEELEPRIFTKEGKRRKRIAPKDEKRWNELTAISDEWKTYQENEIKRSRQAEFDRKIKETQQLYDKAGFKVGDQVILKSGYALPIRGTLGIDETGKPRIDRSLISENHIKDLEHTEGPKAKPKPRTLREKVEAKKPVEEAEPEKVTIEGEEKKTLTLKEQKKYLIDHIDKAIEDAPDKVEVIRDRSRIDFEKTPSVIIDVPGDGKFTIVNSKKALEAFKKKVKRKFPATLEEKKPKAPSMKPTGKRIVSEGIKYYNIFRPRKQSPIVKGKTDISPYSIRYTSDGFFSNGAYGIKIEKPAGLETDKTIAIKNNVPANLRPATLLGEFYFGLFKEPPKVHLKTAEGKDIILDTSYVDAILTKYPEAKAYCKKNATPKNPVVFKEGDKVVGIVMPYETKADVLKGFEDRIAEVEKEKGIEGKAKEATKEKPVVPAKPTAEEMEKNGEGIILGSGLGNLQEAFEKIASKVEEAKLTKDDIKTLKEHTGVFTKGQITTLDRVLRVPQSMARKSPKANELLTTSIERRREKNRIAHEYQVRFESYLPLPEKSRIKIMEVLIEEDLTGDTLPLKVLKKELSDDEIKGYRAVRGNLNVAYKKTREVMLELFGEDSSIMEKMDLAYHQGYVPHVRKGAYYAYAIDVDGTTIWSGGVKNKKELAETIQWLKDTLPDNVEVGGGKNFPTYSEETYQFFSSETTAKMIDDLLMKHGTELPWDTLKRLQTAMKNDLENIAKARAFRKHFIRRKGTPGYITDPLQMEAIIMDYLSGNAGFVSKTKAAGKYHKTLESISEKRYPQLKSWARTYVNEQLRNTTQVDRVTGLVQSILFHKYLGFNPKQLLLNFTQNLIVGIPRLVLEGFNEAEATAAYVKACRFKLTPEEQKLMTKAEIQGDLSAFMTYEFTFASTSPANKAWQYFTEASAVFMQMSEHINRRTTFLAAYRLLRKRGLTSDEAFERAIEITNDIQFLYGKLNRPELTAGGTWEKGVLRAAGTFQLWGLNYLDFLWDAAGQKRGYRAILDSILMLGLLGGVSATLPYAIYKKLHKTVTDMPSMFARWLARNPHDEFKTGLRLGLLGLIGIDLSGSLSTSFTLGGAPYSMYSSIQRAIEGAKRGNYIELLASLSPKGLDNVLMGYKYWAEGYTTKGNKPILKLVKKGETEAEIRYRAEQIQLTAIGFMIKGFGFYPAGISQDMYLRNVVKSIERYFADKKSICVARMRKAMEKGDKKAFFDSLREYKKWAYKAQKYGIRTEMPIPNVVDKTEMRVYSTFLRKFD